MVTTAIILAGGLGTRLKKVVPDLPKPMAIIRERPFLEYQMDFWISQGVTKFILSVGYLKQTIIDHFGDSYHTASINYFVEDEPLGASVGTVIVTVAVSINDAPTLGKVVPELAVIQGALKNTEKSSSPFPLLVTI